MGVLMVLLVALYLRVTLTLPLCHSQCPSPLTYKVKTAVTDASLKVCHSLDSILALKGYPVAYIKNVQKKEILYITSSTFTTSSAIVLLN